MHINEIISLTQSCHKILIDRDSIGGVSALHDILRLIFIKLYKPELLNNPIRWADMGCHSSSIFNADGGWKCSADSLELMRLKLSALQVDGLLHHDIIGYIYEDFINNHFEYI